MAEVAIEVTGLRKTFNGLVAVDNVNFTINKGEIFGFVGPNGSGKTTTIRLLCGLLTPDSGRGQCLGFDLLTQSREIKSRVGYMTQQFSLYNDLSVNENFKFAAQLYGLSNPKKRIFEMMETFKLTDRRNQQVGHLSGGWKQRVALGIALLHKPQLLLLDEPTSGVDLQARREFWTNIENIVAEGVTALVSTHYMDEVIRCHKLAYIHKGRVLAEGTADNLIQESKLRAWYLTGARWRDVFSKLQKELAEWQIAPQQHGLRVIIHDDDTLPDVSKYNLKWEAVELTFEDLFVGLMQEQRSTHHE